MQEQESKAFEEILSVLKTYPGIEKHEIKQTSMLSLPGLKIDPQQRRVYRDGEEVFLTKTEYEILIYLFQNSNHVLTHSQIYERIWREPDYGEARKLVSHHVQAIRRKLNLKQDSGVYLRCIRDVGYSFENRL